MKISLKFRWTSSKQVWNLKAELFHGGPNSFSVGIFYHFNEISLTEQTKLVWQTIQINPRMVCVQCKNIQTDQQFGPMDNGTSITPSTQQIILGSYLFPVPLDQTIDPSVSFTIENGQLWDLTYYRWFGVWSVLSMMHH